MEFTALERAVLDWMASHVNVANLAEQIAACRPTERDLTGVGSFTKLAVPADKPRIDHPRTHSPIGGPWIDGTEGIHLGGSSLLFLDETGYIKTLELVANGDLFDESATGFVLHAYTEPGAAPNGGLAVVTALYQRNMPIAKSDVITCSMQRRGLLLERIIRVHMDSTRQAPN